MQPVGHGETQVLGLSEDAGDRERGVADVEDGVCAGDGLREHPTGLLRRDPDVLGDQDDRPKVRVRLESLDLLSRDDGEASERGGGRVVRMTLHLGREHERVRRGPVVVHIEDPIRERDPRRRGGDGTAAT